MLIEYFLERARIEVAEEGRSYRGYVPGLPEVRVTAPTADACRAKLAGAIGALLAIESRRERIPDNANYSGTDAPAPRTTGESFGHHSALEFSDIIYEKREGVARVTINRPSVYNTYTDHTLREMAAAFRDAAGDASIAVLVLTGAGERAFSAGGDVRQHMEEHIVNPQAARDWMGALIEAHTALRELGKPSVARINGMVAGGGNEWNLACDLAIAADHAKFIQVETKVGLLPAAGGAHWLTLVIGERRAREVFLIGEPISANKALLWGLVNDVVPYKQLDDGVDALCRKLLDRFPEATRLAREQLSFWKDLAFAALKGETAEYTIAQFTGREASEGLRALVEKREVDYASFRVNQRRSAIESKPLPARTRTETRSCYSCGARDIPASYDYCGLCGTRLV
jgi:enoyl-CoA hydratase/carnithine racemase